VFKFYTTSIKQGIVWGVLGEGTFFSPTLLLLNFLICTYLNHYKFHFISLFALSFDTLYLFDLLVLVLDQEEGTHDDSHFSRI